MEPTHLVFPNPVTAGGTLTIKSDQSLHAAEYTIFDATGQEVASGMCKGSAVQIPKSLKAGIYHITPTEGGNSVSVQFVVK